MIFVIKSEKQFNKRAKQLIKMILNGEDIYSLPYEDLNIIALCINKGYIRAKYLTTTEDGKYHFELRDNSTITDDGLRFASPQKNWIAIVTMVATVLTAIATVVSAFVLSK